MKKQKKSESKSLPKSRWSTLHYPKILKSPFVLFSLFILLSSCLLWSILGAQLQSSNADQLINSYLFEDYSTFNAALLPNAHTFLLKWPLFLIVRLFGHSDMSLIIITVFVSLLTVGGLVYVMYRIDRRPQVFGSLLLVLSGILLLIPAQPYGGGLLPVNFAMLATRNIEYLFYIASLVLLLRAPRVRSWAFLGSLSLMALLVASDRLFLPISVGGASIMLVAYGILHRWELVKLAFRWLVVGLGAGATAMVVVWLISSGGITHIIGDSGPYGFIVNPHQLLLAGTFALFSVLTNFGANPLFDIGIVKDMPHILKQRIFEPATVSFLINGTLFILGLIASLRLFFVNLAKPSKASHKPKPISIAVALSLLLICSSLAAVVIFIATDHYYVVDSRYLTITFFALFISLAAFLRSRPIPSSKKVRLVVPVVLCIGIFAGVFWTIGVHQKQIAAIADISRRNQQIAHALENHKTDLLVGDYWRVLPIAQKDAEKRDVILPLSGCTAPRMILTSKKWQVSLENHSFTYLLTLDKSLTDYPSCTIDQVVGSYGYPNASTVIAGTNDNPTEMLFFYDKGTGEKRYKPKDTSKPSTILPIKLPQPMANDECVDGVSVMNIVAHQDDDLLFMNPDLSRHIAAGHCVRSVYVTAGDAGQNSQYWLNREKGSQAAYAAMLGIDKNELWVQRTVKLDDQQFVTIVNPRGNRRISLIFMRLADGNLTGKGFGASNHESLEGLVSNKTAVLHAIDGQSTYTSDQLTHSLALLMQTYQPTDINTQATSDLGRMFHDHSDHIAVGRYAQRAHQEYMNQVDPVPIHYYVGYPIREKSENVSGQDLDRKMDTFVAYGQFDNGVCQSKTLCQRVPTYWSYLHRQYTTEQWTESNSDR